MRDEDAMRLSILAQYLDEIDYYALLEVSPAAPDDTVRDAFHAFAARFHPDQHVDDPARRTLAHAVFKRGSEAWRVLHHPVLRKRYDDALGRGEMRLPVAEGKAPVGGAGSDDIPSAARPFVIKAREALAAGDVGAARLLVSIARTRGASGAVDRLSGEIERAAAAANETDH